MTTTDSPVTEPSPAPDMSRAVPTTKKLREAFATLAPQDKAAVRERVSALVATGYKTGHAWSAAFVPPADFTAAPEASPAVVDRDALYKQAIERKKGGPRGKGRSVDLIDYVAHLRAVHPDAQCKREQEIAYWLEGIALSAPTWTRAWDAATERLAS